MKRYFIYKWLIPAVLVISVAGGYYYYKYYRSPISTSENTTIVRKVEKGSVKSSINASGVIETANYLAVTTSVNGIVKEVFVKEDDTVVKGQKLLEITLDNEGEKSQTSSLASYTNSQVQLQQAKNQLVTLGSTLKQKEEAFKTVKKTTSYRTDEEKLQFQVAEAEYLAAKNAYDLQAKNILQNQLSMSSSSIEYQSQSPVITAPASGVMANIVAVKGMKVENSVSERSIQTVASIKQEGTPIASVNVTEIDINKIKVGQKVNLSLSSIENESYTGTVVGIDRIGESANGVSNYPVIIQFDKDSEKILPNMSVDAEIIAEEKSDVLKIISAAVKKIKDKTFVTQVKNGVNVQTEIKIGLMGDDSTEIIEGLSEGDEIVVSGFSTSGFTTTDPQTQGGGGFVLPGGNVQRRQQ